jgi:hypothetical protein
MVRLASGNGKPVPRTAFHVYSVIGTMVVSVSALNVTECNAIDVRMVKS